MIHNANFRMVCLLLGAGLVALGSCGALNKVSNEGWEGPSSQPGAATKAPARR